MDKVLDSLKNLSDKYKDIPILTRTHGQPASPSRLGKEIHVFFVRIEAQKEMLLQIPFGAKFSGSTGNFNAHQVTYPDINWKKFGVKFVEKKLGLSIRFLQHKSNIMIRLLLCVIILKELTQYLLT